MQKEIEISKRCKSFINSHCETAVKLTQVKKFVVFYEQDS